MMPGPAYCKKTILSEVIDTLNHTLLIQLKMLLPYDAQAPFEDAADSLISISPEGLCSLALEFCRGTRLQELVGRTYERHLDLVARASLERCRAEELREKLHRYCIGSKTPFFEYYRASQGRKRPFWTALEKAKVAHPHEVLSRYKEGILQAFRELSGKARKGRKDRLAYQRARDDFSLVLQELDNLCVPLLTPSMDGLVQHALDMTSHREELLLLQEDGMQTEDSSMFDSSSDPSSPSSPSSTSSDPRERKVYPLEVTRGFRPAFQTRRNRSCSTSVSSSQEEDTRQMHEEMRRVLRKTPESVMTTPWPP